MFALALTLGLIIGIIFGSALSRIRNVVSTVGTLRIDNSDPEETYMFLELYKGVGDISTKKHVCLEVSTENYISQK